MKCRKSADEKKSFKSYQPKGANITVSGIFNSQRKYVEYLKAQVREPIKNVLAEFVR